MTIYYIIGGILLFLNIITFVIFGVDKSQRKSGGERISETTMFLLGMFGGSLGAVLGMHVFDSKTHHKQFYLGMPAFLLLHVIIALIIASFSMESL